MARHILKLSITFLFAALFFMISPPTGLSAPAWHLFGIFGATVLGLIIQSMPEAALLLVSMTAAAILVVPLKDLLLGYADNTVWLIALAVMISVGFRKSGLARRVGLILISKFGKTTLRIGYILGAMDLIMATCTPTAPARTGGIIYPLAEGVFEACDSDPKKNPRRIGSYITVLLYCVSMTTGSLFLTGFGPNLLNAKLANDMLGVKLTWPLWALGAVPGFIGFLLIPLLIYKIYPPEWSSLDGIRKSASIELTKMGAITYREMVAAMIFILILALWVTGTLTGIDATLVAFIGVALMLLLNVFEWKDLAESKETWSTLLWFGAMMGISAALVKAGFFTWLAAILKSIIPTAGIPIFLALILISLLATLPHYLFASLLAYVAAFAPLAYSLIAATDVPRYPAVMLVVYLMGISSALTHYGNGVGPILFAKGFNSKIAWWGVGLTVTVLQATIYLTIGVLYWKAIGLWY